MTIQDRSKDPSISAEKPLWTPPATRVLASSMWRFIRSVQESGTPDITDYHDLYRWSVNQPADFWSAVWRFCDLQTSRPWEQALIDGDQRPGARWFTGAYLNFAQNLMRFRDDRTALIFRREDGHRQQLSYQELYRDVARLAAYLDKLGVGIGDRVAGILPNRPEAVIAMLATTSLGAIWTACSPDFGETGILDRFGQIKPKVLIATDGYHFKGKAIHTLVRTRHILQALPSVEHTLFVGNLQLKPDLTGIPNATAFDHILAEESQEEIDFRQLPFDHPVYILYSSGTTGPPKCIVHGAGGTLLQHLKELVLHTDLWRDDRLFYFTTCGWMMWNWMASGLAVGSTLILYDGAPFHPRAAALFDLTEEEDVSIFGTSASYLLALEKAEVRPAQSHRLPHLRTLLSTGAPLAPKSFDYVYRDIKTDLQLASISGGTDIVSCFALGNPMLPVYKGQLQCRGLGMKVAVFNDAGRPVREEPGELVCTASFPSMPVGFWNDPDGRKFHAAYFDRFPGVWTHGDWAELTQQDGLIIYGRSDTVLNPGGVRIGTAEIYRQVEQLPEVLESAVIGQQWRGDIRIVLFVVLRDQLTLDDALRNRIRHVIRDNTSPRHVPKKILQASELPRTRNGKLVELAIRNVMHGEPVKNLSALANPRALDQFRGLKELDDLGL